MNCRKCGKLAVINMRQHKLALCKIHFPEWIQTQTQRFIKHYKMFNKDERVLVAVSGGKDSLALWDILLTLGYKADALYLGLGIDQGIDYATQSYECTVKFVKSFWPDAKLHVLDVKETYGESIPEVAKRTNRSGGKPCSVCGLIKRHEMNRIAYDLDYDVLATGHNLDDEAAVLWGNTLHWNVGYLARQAPVLPADRRGFARKVKPLCRFYEREMAAYALLRGIDYMYEECPFSVGATSIYYKELLNQMEKDRPGTKLEYYLGFLRAKEQGMFHSMTEESPADLQPCECCGQPTSAPNLCAFCRLWKDKLVRAEPNVTIVG